MDPITCCDLRVQNENFIFRYSATLVGDNPIWNKPASSVSLHWDSQAVIGRVINKSYNDKSRHKKPKT